MATMISHACRKAQKENRLVYGGVDAEPEPVEGREMGDVDTELRVAAEVSGVKVVEVNVQQAQGLSRFACSWFLLPNRG